MTNGCIYSGLICLAAMYVVDSFDLPPYLTCCWTNGGQPNFKFKYLSKFETKFEKLLGYESGSLAGPINENTRGKTNLVLLSI
jgi:hypothetical protein